VLGGRVNAPVDIAGALAAEALEQLRGNCVGGLPRLPLPDRGGEFIVLKAAVKPRVSHFDGSRP